MLIAHTQNRRTVSREPQKHERDTSATHGAVSVTTYGAVSVIQMQPAEL
jgi:hypothetical protein